MEPQKALVVADGNLAPAGGSGGSVRQHREVPQEPMKPREARVVADGNPSTCRRLRRVQMQSAGALEGPGGTVGSRRMQGRSRWEP